MIKETENLTDTELMKKTLLSVQRLKHQGLDPESIFARLEKQGIPDNIAREAVKNVYMQKQIEIKQEEVTRAKINFKAALIRIVSGFVLAAISMIFLRGYVMIPIGLIVAGFISALFAKNRME